MWGSIKTPKGMEKDEIKPSPVEEFFGPALYGVNCRGANLYVHDKVIVIDRMGGVFNVLHKNLKIIPFKSIIAVQARLKEGFSGYIDFETANSPFHEISQFKSAKEDRMGENSIMLKGSKENYQKIKGVLTYIFNHIS